MRGRYVYYDSQYIPPEWIAAHGFVPERLRPRKRLVACSKALGPNKLVTIGDRMGLCPYAGAIAQSAASCCNQGVIFTTLCDQVRRVAEVVQTRSGGSFFLFNMPRTWETETSLRLYRAELRRLGEFLKRLGGKTPTDEELRSRVFEYEEQRRGVRFATTGDKDGRCRVALIGGAMGAEDQWMVECIQDAGGFVALDATEAGELAIPPEPDRRLLHEHPFDQLVFAYFALPHPARRPNSCFYQWLKERIFERRISGIVFVRQTWCDLWNAEVSRIKEFCGLPMIELDTVRDGGARPRSQSRIQALMEMIHERAAKKD